MSFKLCFLLGGVRVAFNSALPRVLLESLPKHSGFVSADLAEMSFTVHIGEYPVKNIDSPLFRASAWSLYQRNGHTVIRMYMPLPDRYYNTFTAVFDPFGVQGDIYVSAVGGSQTVEAPVQVPPFALDEVLAAQLLAAGRGVLLHACGIQTDEQTGVLFSGMSGSGKSTTASLWQQAGGAVLLSDERVAALKQDGRFVLAGTPWHGDGQVPTPNIVPLKHLFILRHSASNQARRLRPAEAVALLVARAYLPVWDKAGMAFSLAFLEELCRATPCYDFGFVPDQSAVEYVKCLSAG